MKFVHYKNGKTYELLHLAIDHQSKVAMVVYRSDGDQDTIPGPDEIWCRPAAEFFGSIMVDNKGMVPRFKLVMEDAR